MKHKLTLYPNIHASVNMGSNVTLIGHRDAFYIGNRSYINDAIISTGARSKVIIGTNCAIGYRVSIKAITHDIKNPCPNDKGKICMLEADIKIGNFCWIGDNVFIREGVILGDNVVVGANSVVTKSFPDNVTIAGVPAKIISGVDNC
ncbi:MAG TPA: acyltransferase [Sulfurimonas autotrophica]|nr:acyltransferase [Sulfurimonas autotrophica]